MTWIIIIHIPTQGPSDFLAFVVSDHPTPPPVAEAPFICRTLKLSLELSRVSLERDSLSRELLRTIRQKVALTQELEAWQVRRGDSRRGTYRGRGRCADWLLPLC